MIQSPSPETAGYNHQALALIAMNIGIRPVKAAGIRTEAICSCPIAALGFTSSEDKKLCYVLLGQLRR